MTGLTQELLSTAAQMVTTIGSDTTPENNKVVFNRNDFIVASIIIFFDAVLIGLRYFVKSRNRHKKQMAAIAQLKEDGVLTLASDMAALLSIDISSASLHRSY